MTLNQVLTALVFGKQIQRTYRGQTTVLSTQEVFDHIRTGRSLPTLSIHTMPTSTSLKYDALIRAALDGKVIQYRRATDGSAKWEDCDGPAGAITNLLDVSSLYSFRVKPDTLVIQVGDVVNEVPAPYHGLVKLGDKYWVASPIEPRASLAPSIWADDMFDRHIHKYSLLHLSQENANLHARALRGEKI